MVSLLGMVDERGAKEEASEQEAGEEEAIEEINTAILAAKSSEKPTMIACKTHIAIGTTAQDTSKGHGALTDPELIKSARQVYKWNHKPFDIPKPIKEQCDSQHVRMAHILID